nr:sigma-70 family RNA polymerase sigma factor [Streptomyces polyasparticus]
MTVLPLPPAMAAESVNLTDEQLCLRVREGDPSAFAWLWLRHRRSTYHCAAQYTRGCASDTEDAVADAMLAMLQALRSGGGPDRNVAAYLHVSVRRAAARRSKQRDREEPVPEVCDKPVYDEDTMSAAFEWSMAAEAIDSLPDPWQSALRLSLVEELPASQIAGRLGISPASASSLLYRAKEALRAAFLRRHALATSPRCAAMLDRMVHAMRGRATNRYGPIIHRHLAQCTGCVGNYQYLQQVNKSLPSRHAA